MILGIVYRNAIRCGMTDHEFVHATLKSINERIKVQEEKEKAKMELIQFIPWDIGRHVKIAILSAFDKKTQYPQNPISVKEVVVNDMEISEDEKDAWAKKWFSKLQKMGEKYEINKKNTAGGA